MPFVSRSTGNHTIREFRLAAGQRYREAVHLATAGDRLAAIYLCGYAAEMLLKAAYFRLIGRNPTAPITISDLQSAKHYATTTLGLIGFGNLHSLTSWAELLVEERRLRGLPLPASMARGLHARVRRIYANWRETIRYRANRPYRGEVADTMQSVFWMLGQYRYL